MALTKQEWIRLEEKADELRKLCLTPRIVPAGISAAA